MNGPLFLSVGFSYIVIGTLIWLALVEGLNWRDNDETFLCALFWPVFLAFWLMIGWPAALLMRTVKALRGLIRRKRETAIVK